MKVYLPQNKESQNEVRDTCLKVLPAMGWVWGQPKCLLYIEDGEAAVQALPGSSVSTCPPFPESSLFTITFQVRPGVVGGSQGGRETVRLSE